jgi:hypothetical protein
VRLLTRKDANRGGQRAICYFAWVNRVLPGWEHIVLLMRGKTGRSESEIQKEMARRLARDAAYQNWARNRRTP